MINNLTYNIYKTGTSLFNKLHEGGNYILGPHHTTNLFNSAKVALTSDVTTNLLLWGFGFGPAYYGWKAIAFTFVSATIKYWGRKEINDYFGENYYHIKHFIAGTFGGGFYYGSNYIFKTILDNNIVFNKLDLIYKLINGSINNVTWEYFSKILQDLKSDDKWLEYFGYAYSIETLDCLFGDDFMSCTVLKQPIGTISRTYGAYIREKIKNKYSENKSDDVAEFMYYYNVKHKITGVAVCVQDDDVVDYLDAIVYDIEYIAIE